MDLVPVLISPTEQGQAEPCATDLHFYNISHTVYTDLLRNIMKNAHRAVKTAQDLQSR